MLSLILRDKGSDWHCKITDEEFNLALTELQEMGKDSEEIDALYEDAIDTITQYADEFEWFDINALKSANKQSIAKFFWLLVRPFQICLNKNNLGDKYGFSVDLNATKNELSKFQSFFKRRDTIGTRFTYQWGGDWTQIFSAGFQGFRLLAGPLGIVLGKIPFVAMAWFVVWVFAAILDWIILGIPYLIMQKTSGLPNNYFEADLILAPYLLGESASAKDSLREIVKNDVAMSEAYVAALWGIYIREKLVEIMRKERKE